MKGTLIALAALLLGLWVGRSWLADPPPADPHPSYLAQLTAQLELTPAQVARVAALLAEEDLAVQELVERTRAELADPIAARRGQTEVRLLALLEPEQRQLYDELSER